MQPPLPDPVPAPAPDPSLAERIARLEATAPQPYSLQAEHAARRAEWLRDHTRTDDAAPCPACGLVGGEQRYTGTHTGGWPYASLWLCPPCTGAVMTGWGTSSRTLHAGPVARDRLACLAASMDAPTADFTRLAARYGLTFTLHREAPATPGSLTPWSHLGDLAEWQELGPKARDREAAGFGVAPPVDVASVRHVEKGQRTVVTPDGPESIWFDKPGTAPTLEQLQEQLLAEERAITATLTERAREQRRAIKERAAQAQEEQREAEVREHYREHLAVLEEQIAEARTRLRAELARALKDPAEQCGASSCKA